VSATISTDCNRPQKRSAIRKRCQSVLIGTADCSDYGKNLNKSGDHKNLHCESGG
jgi:hypothetical protein